MLLTLSKLANWSSIIGALIGIASLLYSILAFQAAKKAKQSADEARRDVRNLVAAEKFHYLRLRARELANHIEFGNFPVAVFLADDLQSEISNSLSRWEFLDYGTIEGFKTARTLAMEVLEFLRQQRQSGQRTRSEVLKMLKKCGVIQVILSGESGKIQSRVERRSKP